MEYLLETSFPSPEIKIEEVTIDEDWQDMPVKLELDEGFSGNFVDCSVLKTNDNEIYSKTFNEQFFITQAPNISNYSVYSTFEEQKYREDAETPNNSAKESAQSYAISDFATIEIKSESDSDEGNESDIHQRLQMVSKALFTCQYCYFGFYKEEPWTIHETRTCRERPALRQSSIHEIYHCDKCEYECRYKGSLARHELLLHSNKIKPTYPCAYCEFSGFSHWDLRQHLSLSHPVMTRKRKRLYICRCCNENFETTRKLDSHQLSCHQDKDISASVKSQVFTCPSCTYCSPFQCSITRHVTKEHINGANNHGSYMEKGNECEEKGNKREKKNNKLEKKVNKRKEKGNECEEKRNKREKKENKLAKKVNKREEKGNERKRYKERLAQHELLLHINKIKPTYRCAHCEFCGLSHRDLRQHLSLSHPAKIRNSKRLHICPCCNENFETTQKFDSHLLSCHQNKDISALVKSQVFRCPSCTYCSPFQCSIAHHVIKEHINGANNHGSHMEKGNKSEKIKEHINGAYNHGSYMEKGNEGEKIKEHINGAYNHGSYMEKGNEGEKTKEHINGVYNHGSYMEKGNEGEKIKEHINWAYNHGFYMEKGNEDEKIKEHINGENNHGSYMEKGNESEKIKEYISGTNNHGSYMEKGNESEKIQEYINGTNNHVSYMVKENESEKTREHINDANNHGSYMKKGNEGEKKGNKIMKKVNIHEDKGNKRKRGYECQLCSQWFYEKIRMTSHLLKKHPHEDISHLIMSRIYLCRRCDFKSATEERIRTHMRRVHLKEHTLIRLIKQMNGKNPESVSKQ